MQISKCYQNRRRTISISL